MEIFFRRNALSMDHARITIRYGVFRHVMPNYALGADDGELTDSHASGNVGVSSYKDRVFNTHRTILPLEVTRADVVSLGYDMDVITDGHVSPYGDFALQVTALVDGGRCADV
jgi:hypothetical protein